MDMSQSHTQYCLLSFWNSIFWSFWLFSVYLSGLCYLLKWTSKVVKRCRIQGVYNVFSSTDGVSNPTGSSDFVLSLLANFLSHNPINLSCQSGSIPALIKTSVWFIIQIFQNPIYISIIKQMIIIFINYFYYIFIMCQSLF